VSRGEEAIIEVDYSILAWLVEAVGEQLAAYLVGCDIPVFRQITSDGSSLSEQ
jgi:hypothetical protein